MNDHRIHILVFDDGTATAVTAATRAAQLADELLVVSAHGSPNRSAIGAMTATATIPTEFLQLERHEGIRHALAVAAERGLCVAYVPTPTEHPGQVLRKCVQAVGTAGDEALPALAVRFVREREQDGPVVEVTPAQTDAGFVALFAICLAMSTEQPLHILRLADDDMVDDEVDVRATEQLDVARAMIARDGVPVLDEWDLSDDWSGEVRAEAADASAVVVGLGGLAVTGRKWTAPTELPDAVLETRSGALVHDLVRDHPGDVVVVIDGISLRHGMLPGAAAASTVAATMGTGALAGVPGGLAIFTAGLAVSAVTLASAARATDE